MTEQEPAGSLLLPAFSRFPKEALIIGKMLAGYSDLEVELMNCVHVVRDFDLDTVLKTMFRTRGETQRIQIADAMGRQFFVGLKLDTEFAMTISAIQYCLKTRNQYAHSVWDDHMGQLSFVNLEALAGLNSRIEDFTKMVRFQVDLPLLQEQERYFAHALDMLTWLNHEARCRNGKLTTNPFVKPKQRTQPDLCIS